MLGLGILLIELAFEREREREISGVILILFGPEIVVRWHQARFERLSEL